MPPETTTSSAPERRHLLLLDASEIVLAYETPLLAAAGFEVRGVSSLRSFQHTLATWQPHLIVTDLQLPEMIGAELCQWLRDQSPTRIPIVLCSSAPEPQLAELARTVGADAYLSKDTGVEQLPERLLALCSEIQW